MTYKASPAAWVEVLQHPGAFALRVLRAFRKNQGLLLAGAVAYYALLSIVPLLILSAIALSHLVSSLAFTVLENAMSIIFFRRVAVRRRHFLVSAILPYCYILFLGAGLLVVTLVAGGLEAVGRDSIDFLGLHWSLDPFSRALLYLVGVAGEIFVVTSIYLVMPVGRLSLRHAVFRHPFRGEPGLWVAHHRHRGPAQPGGPRRTAPLRRPGDLGVRAGREGRALVSVFL